MPQLSIDFNNLFVRSPGELLYFMIVILVALAGVFMTVSFRTYARPSRDIGKYAVASSGMALAWGLLLVGIVVASASGREAATILPPLERLALMQTLILFIWAFLDTSESNQKSARDQMIGAGIIALIAYLVTAVAWLGLAGTEDFNLSVYGTAWTAAFVAVCVAGVGLLVLRIRQNSDVPLKIVTLFILFSGFGWTLSQMTQGNIIGDYAGMARLSFVAAILVFMVIVYRVVLSRAVDMSTENRAPTMPVSASKLPVLAERQTVMPAPAVQSPLQRESVQLLRALGLILEEATAENIPERVVQAVINVLKVDVAGLVRLKDANYADFITAHDAFMSKALSPMALNLDHQPTLANAVERRAQRRILPDEEADEVQDLFTRLDIDQVGPAYFQPLTHDRELVGVLVIAQPYTQRELYNAESEMLRGIAVIAGGLLALGFEAVEKRKMAEERAIHAMIRGVPPEQVGDSEVIKARQEAEASLQLAREQISDLSDQVVQLTKELDSERSQFAVSLDQFDDDMTMSQRFRAVTVEQKKLASERDSLARRLQEAEAALAGATASDSEAIVRRMIDSLEREKSDLQSQRTRLQSELDAIRGGESLPQIARNIIEDVSTQKQALEAERDQLKSDLDAIQAQLADVGIDAGSAGLSQLINQLYQQNAELQSANNTMQTELDRMASEHSRLQEAIQMEEARVMRIQMLEAEVKNLAEDREALEKQRNKIAAERDELHSKIDEIKQHRARLMAQTASYEIEFKEAHAVQNKLRDDIRKLSNVNSDLVNERDRLRGAKDAAETDRDQMLAMMQGDRDRLHAVGEQGVGALKTMIESLTEQRNMLEHELNATRKSLADVENQLDALKLKANSPSASEPRYTPENPELMVSLVQELRTPMTSIRGYVDLLLAESAGILGEMQRKFLQRVFTNTNRLENMVEDLVQMTQLDTGKIKLNTLPVDVVGLIESAITEAAPQFREKRLTINLNLDHNAPVIHGDDDAISQIIGQLLTNAYLVSPPNTEISIRAEHRQLKLNRNGAVKPVDCLYVSIEDRGGGIPPEDEARVFARKYRADNPLIDGLGDTGVGLSVARALVEAHGGSLWLDSHENVGTIFSFALPVEGNAKAEA